MKILLFLLTLFIFSLWALFVVADLDGRIIYHLIIGRSQQSRELYGLTKLDEIPLCLLFGSDPL